MTVVKTPIGNVDFGNKTDDEIRSIIQSHREKFGLKPLTASPASGSPSPAPTPQPAAKGAPTGSPGPLVDRPPTDPRDNFTIRTVEGLQSYLENRPKRDAPWTPERVGETLRRGYEASSDFNPYKWIASLAMLPGQAIKQAGEYKPGVHDAAADAAIKTAGEIGLMTMGSEAAGGAPRPRLGKAPPKGLTGDILPPEPKPPAGEPVAGPSEPPTIEGEVVKPAEAAPVKPAKPAPTAEPPLESSVRNAEAQAAQRRQQFNDIAARGGKDTDFREMFSAGARVSNKRGETWRARAEKFVQDQEATAKRLRSERVSPADAGVPPPRPPNGAGPPPPNFPTSGGPKVPAPPPPPGRASATPEGAVRQTLGAMQRVFSPSTAGRAEGVYGLFNPLAQDLRRELGAADREVAIARGSLDPFIRKFNELPSGWDSPDAPIGEQPKGYTQADWAAYVERDPGASRPKDPELAKAADAWRKAAERVETLLKDLPKYAHAELRENYLTHFWKRNDEIEKELGALHSGKLGTGRYMKERTIPSLSEGLKAGWTPLFDNLYEGMYKYLDEIHRHIAKENIIQMLKDTGQITWHAPGFPPLGKAPLKNVINGHGWQAAIDADAAMIYNNFISKGLSGIQVGKSSLQGPHEMLRTIVNAETQVTLAFSAYHALNVLKSAGADAMARAIGSAATGHFGIAAKEFGKGVFAPITYPFIGKKMMNQWARTTEYGERMERIAAQAQRANPQLKRNRSIDFQATAAGSFIKAARQGSLSKQLMNDFRLFKSSPVAQALPMTVKQFGRIADTFNAWLFNHLIPTLKAGALHQNLSNYLERFPNATQEDLDRATRAFVDSIDNRFGEMVKDNTFWHKLPSDIAQLAMLSYTWQMGFFREFAGAIGDITKAARFRDPKYLSTRVNYLLGHALYTAMIGATVSTLWGGKKPNELTLEDLSHPVTGGRNPDGTPQRMQMPGHTKDIDKWMDAITSASPTKAWKNLWDAANPFWHMFIEVGTGTNWKNQLTNPTDEISSLITRTMAAVKEHFTPISIQQYQKGHPKGDKFNVITDILGLRPAPQAQSEPAKAQLQDVKRRLFDLEHTLRSDRLIANRSHLQSDKDKVKQDMKDRIKLLKQRAKAQHLYNESLPKDKYVGTVAPQQ